MNPGISTQHPRSAQQGQVLVIYALALVVLLGFAALAVDVGFLLAERRGVQNAADAAARATARHVARTGDLAQAEAVGLQYAAANGFPASAATTIDIDTATGGVSVEIDHEVEGFFLRVLYTGDWGVSVRSGATILTDQGPFAMIALGEDPSCHPSQSGIVFQGSADAVIQGGSVGSNSCVRVNGDPDVFIDGNVEAMYQIRDQQDSIELPPGAFKSGNMNRIDDPFEGVTPPTCSDEGEEIENGDRVLLTPGFYKDRIREDTILLTPGVYCFRDRVTLQGGVLRSVDLVVDPDVDIDDPDERETLFDAVDAEPNTANGGVVVYFESGGHLHLVGSRPEVKLRSAGFLASSPDGCGPACDENFVIWMGDPGCRDFAVRGNAENELFGVIYAPCSQVSLGGTSDTATLTGMVVADSIEIFGNATFNLVANNEYEAAPARVFLTE